MLIIRPRQRSTKARAENAHDSPPGRRVRCAWISQHRLRSRPRTRRVPAKIFGSIAAVRDARALGERKARRVALVGQRRARFRRDKSGARAASISAAMLEPRPEIRIAVRTRALTASAPRASRRARRRAATSRPISVGARPCSRERAHRLRLARAAANATMPKPQLNVRSISASPTPPAFASQPNTGGGAKAVEIELDRERRRAARAADCRESRRR